MASSAYPSSAGSYIFNSIIDRRACLALLALTALPAPALAADAPALLLAQVYRPGLPLQDYWVSEKYDGVRGYWDGRTLRTRGGTTVAAPVWFTAGWPDTPMDGELWAGRGRFGHAQSTTRQQQPDEAAWRQLRFMVFDLPTHGGTFDERLPTLQQLVVVPYSNPAAKAGDWAEGKGSHVRREVLHAYVTRMLEGLAGIDAGLLARQRIGWDAGNGAAGPVVEKLVQLLPGEHHLLFTNVDGNFPNHHPDPTEEANLADLRSLVLSRKLDFGVAFDGDGDRIGAIDGQGRIVWGDQLLMIYAEDLLRNRPHSTIIADVKASRALFDRVAELGGQPLMWKTGHSLIKSKMKETGAPLAGEMSGHVFFADTYYGFDDALYAGVRLLAAAARLGKSVTELRGAIPPMLNTPEMRFPCPEERKFLVVEEVLARLDAMEHKLDRLLQVPGQALRSRP